MDPTTASSQKRAFSDVRQSPDGTGDLPPARPRTFYEAYSSGFDWKKDWNVTSRYRLEKIVGHGAYGHVAQAFDVYLKKNVAIKKVGNLFQDLVDARRVLREICILRRLNCPYLIQILDVMVPPNFPKDETIYVVMDFVDTDLFKVIHSQQYFQIEHVDSILYQLLCGLLYLHSAGVIHRDIKPANILVNMDVTIKIGDFGMARRVPCIETLNEVKDELPNIQEISQNKKDASQITAHASSEVLVSEGVSTPVSVVPGGEPSALSADNSLRIAPGSAGSSPPVSGTRTAIKRTMTKHVVTRHYRAPELLVHDEYNASVDVWSLGCIFAELLQMLEQNCSDYRNRSPIFPGKSSSFSPRADDSPSAEYAHLNSQLNPLTSAMFPGSHRMPPYIPMPNLVPVKTIGTVTEQSQQICSDDDQICVICRKIGRPSEEFLSHIPFVAVREKLKTFPDSKVNWKNTFPSISDSAADLLEKMLRIDPSSRITVEEALVHPFLKTVKSHAHEYVSQKPIELAMLDSETNITQKELEDAFLSEVTFWREHSARLYQKLSATKQ